MKRLSMLLLAACILLSGCSILPDAGSSAENASGDIDQQPGGNFAVNTQTGVDLHDNAPDLAEVGAEEYLAYFQASEDFVTMTDFHDERNPYEARLAAEKEALGKNFEEYYLEQGTMIPYFENLVEKNLDAYNEDKGLDDSVYLYLVAFQSMELAMGSSFSEEDDWATLQKGMVMAVEMFGGSNATVTRNSVHNYTIAYTGDEGEEIVDHFRADLGDGIQMLSYCDGKLSTFFEFRELGNDTYVWQNGRERLVMTYKDKEVFSCYYSYLPEDAQRYGEADLVFSAGNGFDATWVMERDNFHTRISFDGTTLEVTTTNFFFGGIGHAVISPVQK